MGGSGSGGIRGTQGVYGGVRSLCGFRPIQPMPHGASKRRNAIPVFLFIPSGSSWKPISCVLRGARAVRWRLRQLEFAGRSFWSASSIVFDLQIVSSCDVYIVVFEVCDGCHI